MKDGGRKSSDSKPEYQVGYKKPPLQSRFKKGRSGNLKGRKKKPTELERMKGLVQEKVTVTLDGRAQEISVREALVRSCMGKALKGSVRDARQFVALLKDMNIDIISDEDKRKLDGSAQREALEALKKLRQEISNLEKT